MHTHTSQHHPQSRSHNIRQTHLIISHAGNVVWDVQYHLRHSFLATSATDLQLYAAIIAAAVHDFRHPGRTNLFLQHTAHDIAIHHNDDSCLERFHVAQAFAVAVAMGKRAPFLELRDDQYRSFRGSVVKMVLSTVWIRRLPLHICVFGSVLLRLTRIMCIRVGVCRCNHRTRAHTSSSLPCSTQPCTDLIWVTMLAHMRCVARVPRANTHSRPLITRGSLSDVTLQAGHIQDALQAVIMMADIGHATKRFDIHRRWSQALREEFFA